MSVISESYIKRKRIMWCSLLAIFIAVCLYLSLPLVMAAPSSNGKTYSSVHTANIEKVEAESDEAEGDTQQGSAAYSGWKKSYLVYYYDIKDYLSNPLISAVTDVFGSDGSQNSVLQRASDEVKNPLQNMQKVMKGLGLVMAFFFAMSNIFNELKHGDLGIDMWARISILAIVGIALVMSYDVILKACENVGKYIVERSAAVSSRGNINLSITSWADSIFDYGPNDIKTVKFSLKGLSNLWNNICVYVITIIKYAGSFILFFILQLPLLTVRAHLYMIWVEIIVRKMFFPLAIADCVGEGPRSPGVAYIKRVAANYVEVALAYLVALIITYLINSFTNVTALGNAGFIGGFLYMATLFVIYNAAPAFLKSCREFSHQIVGLH